MIVHVLIMGEGGRPLGGGGRPRRWTILEPRRKIVPIIPLLPLIFIRIPVQILVARFRRLRPVPIAREIGRPIVRNYIGVEARTVRVLVPRGPLRWPLLCLGLLRFLRVVRARSVGLLPRGLVVLTVLRPARLRLLVPGEAGGGEDRETLVVRLRFYLPLRILNLN